MIIYDTGLWAASLAISWEGSVVPKTLIVAFPAGVVAAILTFTFSLMRSELPDDIYDSNRTDAFLGSFTSVLGFLIVFRTRIAYSRFWEAASFLQTIRGGWFNVVSSCCAFCSAAENKIGDVFEFQHTIVRLVSLLYAAALHEVAVMQDNSVEVLDFECFDKEQFEYMSENSKKVEILMQWVQRLIVDGHRRGTLDIPPPILSRVFQELANGVIDLANAKRICRYPFPFPYAQIQSLLLLFHWGISVWIAGTTMGHPLRAFIFAFVSTFCLWSMHYTSLEIEQPYGDDMNDLPLDTMQTSLNDSLVNLLHPLTQTTITVNLDQGDDIDCKLWSTDHDPNKRMKEKEKQRTIGAHAGPKVPKKYTITKRYQVVGLEKRKSNYHEVQRRSAKKSVNEDGRNTLTSSRASRPISQSIPIVTRTLSFALESNSEPLTPVTIDSNESTHSESTNILPPALKMHKPGSQQHHSQAEAIAKTNAGVDIIKRTRVREVAAEEDASTEAVAEVHVRRDIDTAGHPVVSDFHLAMPTIASFPESVFAKESRSSTASNIEDESKSENPVRERFFV